ncbi:MAG: Tryptophan synthase alpha chain, partial [bacterium]|nr:Tryptophan synthase alpha chain [bacterium]
NSSFEKCDGQDNDCNGCIDDGMTAPPICSTLGVCGTTTNTVACSHSAAGFKCTYGPGVDVDAMGNLLPTEKECDNLDNNCNGPCDENFPDVAVSGGGCTNPRTAKACSGGQGACLLTGLFACKPDTTAEACFNGSNVVAPTGDLTKASDEKCNGKDDDCNGLVDEATDYTAGGVTYKGWHDPVARVDVGLDPFTAQAAHTVYVYAYEASRPDASATSPGSQPTRACANYGVLPWANVTLRQAQAACAGIKDTAGTSIGRLCSAWEWQQACNGNVASPPSHWSMSTSTTAYQAQVCNDSAEVEQRCNPTAVNCAKTCNAQNQCTCTADSDCPGAAAGSCDTIKKVCTTSVCPLQCAKTCNGSGQCTCLGNADCAPGFTCNGSNICVGSGAWPTGSIGSFVGGDQCYVDEPVAGGTAGGRTHDLSGNLQEWTSTGVVLKSGAAATMTASAGGQSTIGGLTNIFSTDVGAQIIISGSTKGNNGTYDIVAVTPPSSATVTAAAAVAESGLTWKFVYNKIRGGNYATTASGGDTCEFDFDIQKASFANTDVGFRCCSDVKP